MGVLMAFADGDATGQAYVTAFREGLQELGWTPALRVFRPRKPFPLYPEHRPAPVRRRARPC